MNFIIYPCINFIQDIFQQAKTGHMITSIRWQRIARYLMLIISLQEIMSLVAGKRDFRVESVILDYIFIISDRIRITEIDNETG